MQYTTDLFGMTFIVGMIVAIIATVCYLYLYLEKDKISFVPSFYGIGSLISFWIGMSIVIGELTYPLYSQIGLAGGYFLLVLSFIQTYYELKMKGKKTVDE